MTGEIPKGFERWFPGQADNLAGAGVDWLADERRRAKERVATLEMPASRHEGWRYTSLKGLQEQDFSAAERGRELTALELERILIPGLDSYRAVLVNGRFIAELSQLGDPPAGARIGGLRAVLDSDPGLLRERINRLAGDQQSLFSALNTAALDDGFVALIDRALVLDRPIELIHLSIAKNQPRVAQPRHLVVLEAGAQATLIERYISLDDSVYCTNSVLEIALSRDAVLKHERLQLESPNAFHLTGLYLSQDANSRYQGVNIGLGASWSRTELSARFCGEHAECDLQGLYLAGDRQLVDYHIDVEHAVSHCVSRETFKGVLYGKGKAVFDGRVYVAKNAQKTDAAMSNRNLMLSESAEVDAKPQLEINADDVKCSHGTTVGQIEPEMLFYLRSRGISAPLARRMLCLGFAGEIIQALSSEVLREHVEDEVGRRLETAPLS
jgi:Fe-S cluster assembly protein SufD